ncbi:hypothetical protein [Anaeromyxobacter oryzisoli]|uniref:hypothetical protein n=1 Tax=Anaeromyxobacter oryzisoli TaxID=2925408 RepID=UPI001F55E1CA|nr:hypothetical protein [Anaeromyxobacter sp. SG63]
MKLVRIVRSPSFALAVIGFVAVYSAVGAWLPWSSPGGRPAPAWAAALRLDHPFSAPPFLVAVAALLASVLACTWGKRGRILRLGRGELPPTAMCLPPRPGADPGAFLRDQGFRRRGEIWTRCRAGLWGGWVLHVGLLALIAGVLVQQSLFDTGLFELTEGETAKLDAPGALLWRSRGVLARATPPDVEVTLHWFDPYASQEGYARDRLSQLGVVRRGHDPVTAFLDRSAGIRAGGLQFFQAIPTGYAVNLDVPGLGRRSVHLRPEMAHLASIRLDDPSGRPARFLLTAAGSLDDPMGTGPIRVELEQDGVRRALQRGAAFRFGDRDATLLSVGRWGQYTYARAPGMSAVFAGFALVLAGCALLLLPAGVARVEDGAIRAYLVRGGAALAADWTHDPPPGAEDRRLRTEGP